MEKLIIINSGNGVGGGASKLTGDVTQIISQLPPILESLTALNSKRSCNKFRRYGIHGKEEPKELPRRTNLSTE